MRETSSALLAKAASATRILWGAFVVAVLIYGYVVWQTAHSPNRPFIDRGPLASDPMLPPLVLAACGALAFGRLVPRRIWLSEARLRLETTKDAFAALRGNNALRMEDLEAIKALAEVEQRPFKLTAPWQTALVVEWAAYDAIALFGLTIGFLRHEPLTFVPFGLVSICALLTARPRLDDLLELARGVS